MAKSIITNEDVEEAMEDLKEEEAEDKAESDRELMEEMKEEDAEAYGYPEAEEKFERFKFLSEVRDREDTIRTSFLTKTELGTPLLPVRFWLNLKLLADLKRYDIVSGYLYNKAIVTTHSGLSREGFLLNIAVTKRKETAKRKIKPLEVKSEK